MTELVNVFWRHIECDMHDVYGVDTADLDLMSARSWPWLVARIQGLLDVPSRLSEAVLT